MGQFSSTTRFTRTLRRNSLQKQRIIAVKRERGDLAVIIAVLAAVLLVLIPLAAYAASVNLLPLSRGNQDYQAALAAAESGVANFVNEINTNSTTSPALATTNWIQVVGAPKEYYYYSASYDSRNSTYYITSSGISLHGQQTYTRTVKETITPASYNTFELYYNTFQQATAMQAFTNCTTDCTWNINNLPPGQTSPGTFYSEGNYYSNSLPKPPPGVILETGGQYDGVTTFCSTSAWYKYTGNSGACQTGSGLSTTSTPIREVPPISFPGTTAYSSQLQDLASANGGGCYYQGPTMITMNTPPQATAPSFDVYSPGTPNTAPNYNNCGGDAMHSLPGATVTNFAGSNGVIYVDQIPAGSTCATVDSSIPTYLYGSNPCNGDLLISGTTGSQITVGAAQDVTLVNNLVYADCSGTSIGNNDIIGLAAGADLGVAVDAWGSLPLLGNSTPSTFSTSSCLPVVAANSPSAVGTNDALAMGAFFALGGSVIPIQPPGCATPAFSKIDFYGNIVAGYAGLNGFPTSSYGCGGAHFTNALSYDNRFLSLIPPNFPFQPGTFSGAATWKEVSNPSGLPALP